MLAYANRANAYQQYKEQNVMTAGPGELTLMLYDGCIKDLKLAKMYFEQENIEKRNQMLLKAQDIIAELIGSLDMSYGISEQLFSLYEYMLYCLREANINKDVAKLDIVIELISDLRDTWQQAVKLTRGSYESGDKYERG